VKLTVCESPAELSVDSAAWKSLASSARELKGDVFLLNEMPFGSWIAKGESSDRDILSASQRAHQTGLKALSDLGARVVLGTYPTLEGGRSLNQGFVWEPGGRVRPVHTKQYFPNEPGYFEARWFERGDTHFRVEEVGGLRVGFLICTEVMFNEWARHYRREGAHLIVVPRATPPGSLARWKVAIAMAAIVSGCYVASSNRAGRDGLGQEFGGGGWIFDPFGKLMAETSPERPMVSATLDPSLPAAAQREYPCYVEELPSPVVR
jgi:N-carbamoylputrescine amidase